jgi:signal transduction histidine kinase
VAPHILIIEDDARRAKMVSDYLGEAIDEILLASRLEAVKELDVDEEVDLLGLASEECARYDAIELEGRPVTVRGDPRLLRRMIRNLLENARRHGAPPIAVSVGRAGGGVELRVCDHWPGIAEAERESVFRPFHRGLGLALVRQIARRHAGEARYLGREQTGSCFVVSL